MEAKAEGRASLTELSKRKRDGVYYTPEWVTRYVVEETVGAHLLALRRDLGIDGGPTPSEEDVEQYQRSRSGVGRRFAPRKIVLDYLDTLDKYGDALQDIKVVDPACGSGAFLIQALDALVEERRWIARERERITGTAGVFDVDAVTKGVLSQNIYGVDINEESIEITRLALWLHTALPDRPLSSLDDNIRCGNSLIGSDFYKYKQQSFTPEEKERVNAFDWRKAFASVFDREGPKGGFDCVIGNPPYVKLQHFKQVMPEVADYLLHARRADGTPLYASTQTQNFDMYLPFIEQGTELLNAGGRMGYIAPNVWMVNEYGKGLRNKMLDKRRLERWIDFKDFQVFEEAITYTALQFYRGKPSGGVSCMFEPEGEVAGVDWSHPDAIIAYTELPRDEPWVLLPRRERDLLERLRGACLRLDDAAVSTGIVVGIQTSADHIYHLERVAPGLYLHFPKKKPPVEVELEDAIMRPLISGDAKRYQAPSTSTFLLFPYDDGSDRVRLFGTAEMEQRFPKAWKYLGRNEAELRQRESGAFDDDQWYRFGRNQNVDKQKLRKLGVAQTVPEMRVFYDSAGAYCFNNVRVNGILTRDEDQGWFLLGVLNGRVADFVFRRIAKPKDGGYFEANKQFIAPLPIPMGPAPSRRARSAVIPRA